MSISHSDSIDSLASTATVTTISPNVLAPVSSNALYEDQEHFQAIFSNDSRFFDTSLYLYKSYSKLGYIQSNMEKVRKRRFPILKTSSHGYRHRWKQRLIGLGHSRDSHPVLSTAPLLRKNDHSSYIRADSDISTNEARNYHPGSPINVQYVRKISMIGDPIDEETDESEVAITKL